MRCPSCSYDDDRVLDTRIQKDGGAIRRRRECNHCKTRFSTMEILVSDSPLPHVVKKDGRREPFNKDKLSSGLQAACQKRPIGLGEIERIVDRIAKLVLSCEEKEVQSHWIGQLVMEELKSLDDVAYVRFASVYRTFKDVQEFVQTLKPREDGADFSPDH